MESHGSGDDNVSVPVSKQTVQTHSTVVQQEYHGTGALDWTQVGGVVHEGEGVYMNSVDILPRWEHPHFKPNCSRRHNTIYLEDTAGDTISSPYLLEDNEGDSELGEGRGRRELSWRVVEEVRRIEGGTRKHGDGEEEEKECISLTG